jgi:hypothetical protein
VTDASIDTIFTILHKVWASRRSQQDGCHNFSIKKQKHERVRIRQEGFLTTPTHQICHQLTLFLFLKVKEHMADTFLTQNHFQSIWERVTMTFTTEEVTAAYTTDGQSETKSLFASTVIKLRNHQK